MLLLGLILWGVGLFVLYLVIRGAISDSKMAGDIEEIRNILREFKEQIDSEQHVNKEVNLKELEERVFNTCFSCQRPIKPGDEVCSSCGPRLK